MNPEATNSAATVSASVADRIVTDVESPRSLPGSTQVQLTLSSASMSACNDGSDAP